MTVKRNSTIMIATLTDWLINVAPVFQLMRSKTNRSSPESARLFSRALSKLQVIARNSDWFITLFATVGIGRRNYFSTVI